MENHGIDSAMLASMDQMSHNNVQASRGNGSAGNVGLDGIGGDVMPKVHGSMEEPMGGLYGNVDGILSSIQNEAALKGSITDFAQQNMLPFQGMESFGAKDFDGSQAVKLSHVALQEQANFSPGAGMAIVDKSQGSGQSH